MANQLGTAKSRERHVANVKIGDTSECLEAISAAITKRAYEISQRARLVPGSDRENLRLAENEILQPICCGLLESKEGVTVSMFCSAIGPKDIEEVEVCVEPHRLILAGKKRTSSGSAQAASVYRVLPLADEFDPSSVEPVLKQHGSLLEIKIHKVGKKSLIENRAA